MSTTYKVIPGDTFELIARKVYGTELESSRLQAANPGFSEPLVAGAVLSVPRAPKAPRDQSFARTQNPDNNVSIEVNGRELKSWTSARITRSVDSIDAITIDAPFNIDDPVIVQELKPFSFPEVEVSVGGERLFTGVAVGITPLLDATKRVITITGYAACGVLNDCSSPASGDALEFRESRLEDIAPALASPFGIDVEFDADTGAVFEHVAITAGERVLAFFTKLAQQRGLIIGSEQEGNLVFRKARTTGAPVAKLEQGQSPLVSIVPQFNAQKYYSDITGIEPMVVGLKGSRFTVKNPRLNGVVRPFTFEVPDTKDADLGEAVRSKAGRMFANVAAYSVTVASWRDPSGQLWEPNSLVTLTAAAAMIYKEYTFLIRAVEFSRSTDGEVVTLSLVMPEAFAGNVPRSLPWD